MVILEWPLLTLMVFAIAFATCLALWTEIQIIQIKTDSKNELSDLKQDIKKNGNLVLKHIIIAEFLKSEEGKKIIFDMIKNMNIAEIKNDNERLNAYENLGYTKEAMNDENWYIRLRAYENLGFTKEALKDEDWRIRINAYVNLGYTKEALNDGNPIIRIRAKEYFKNKGE